jgi:biotin transport system substrate-specific component
MVVAGAGTVGIFAQVAVPLSPVPITGQTLAVLLVASALGATRGALAMIVYALAGAFGVPWFSDGSSGAEVLLGPTGGYIVGFIMAAALTGWLAERKWDRRFAPALLAFVLGTAAPFAIGLPWLALSLGLGIPETLAAGLYPFVVPGIVKSLVAAAVTPFLWRAVNRRPPTGTEGSRRASNRR